MECAGGAERRRRFVSRPIGPLPQKPKRRRRFALPAHSISLIAIVVVCAFSAVFASEFSAPDKDSPEMAWWRDSMKTRDQRLAWWREARFGMFVHWGVYSGLGGTWEGQKVTGYAEHIQRRLKIPIPVYREEVAGKFNPTNFNADEWIRTAKEAGMGYFIITSKHHDGFAMFDSKVSDYNIVKATPFKRDPMKELKAACQRYGLKFGFYYSHAYDWGDENAPGNDWDYENSGGDRHLHGTNWWTTDPQLLVKVRKYVDGKAIPQLRELIKSYDPDILWFDTPSKLPESENFRVLKAVREASSKVVINGRLVRSLGDYESTTDRPAEFPPHEGDWEGIPTTNESYGWNQNDHSHKPPAHFIQLLAKAAARGGNILMNVGPMGNGQMDPKDVEILHGIGQWMKVNGDSIKGTTRTPLAVQSWGESTRKGNTLYLHVFDWPSLWPREGELVVGGLKTQPKRAFLLADPKRKELKVARESPLDVVVQCPTNAPDLADSVVVLECEGEIATDPARLLSKNISEHTLRVFDGECHGRLRFGPGKAQDAYVQNWSKKGQSISWPIRVERTSSFEVTAIYDAPSDSAGGGYSVKIGSKTLAGTVKSGQRVSSLLGTVLLGPGRTEVQVQPEKIEGGELMRLRSVVLSLAEP